MTVLRTIQQLNAPQPVQVQAGHEGMPESVRVPPVQTQNRGLRKPQPVQRSGLKAIRSDGLWMRVVSVEDFWKINDEWWRGEEQEIERIYFDLVLESSQRMTVFHDLVRDEWFRQSD